MAHLNILYIYSNESLIIASPVQMYSGGGGGVIIYSSLRRRVHDCRQFFVNVTT